MYCDMTNKNGVGVTVISHDSESRITVDGMKIKVVTHVILITQERVYLSSPVSPLFPYTANSLSSTSVTTQFFGMKPIHMDGGCHVILLR